MNEIVALRASFDGVVWDRYLGATVAFVAYRRSDSLLCLACRVMLTPEPASPDWEFSGKVDSLEVARRWLSVDAAKGLLDAVLTSGSVSFSGQSLALNRPDGASYLWNVQPYYPNVREQVGWPSLQLLGAGDQQYKIVGLDAFRRLERRLPAARPKSFANWANLGHFLGGGGGPLRLAESEPTQFEFAVPALARISAARITAEGRLEVIVESQCRPPLTDLSVCIAWRNNTASETIPLSEADVAPDGSWQIRRDLGSESLPVQATLIADGEAVEVRHAVGAAPSPTEGHPGGHRRRAAARDVRAGSTGTAAASISFADLHPVIRDRCQTAFEAGMLEEAVFNAFKALEDAVRQKGATSTGEVGVSLISRKMNPKQPNIVFSEDLAEREAAHALFRGALGAFKNPRSHRFVETTDPVETLETLALASLMLRLLERAPVAPVGQ